jgi:hypothetical protein
MRPGKLAPTTGPGTVLSLVEVGSNTNPTAPVVPVATLKMSTAAQTFWLPVERRAEFVRQVVDALEADDGHLPHLIAAVPASVPSGIERGARYRRARPRIKDPRVERNNPGASG